MTMSPYSWFRPLLTRKPRPRRPQTPTSQRPAGAARRVRLALEQLEERLVPSTNQFANGVLSLTAPLGDLTVTQTANNTFQVADSLSSSSPTFSAVSNILIDSGDGTHNFALALGGNIYNGNLVINLHNGSDSVMINNGSMRGNTTIATRTGNDTVCLGNTGNLSVGGSMQLTNSSGAASLALAGGGNVSIAGKLSVTAVATVTQGAYSLTVGGPTTFQDAPLWGSSSVKLGGAAFVTAGLSIVGGPVADSVSLSSTTVNGPTAITLGAGQDTFNVTGTNTFNGNFSFVSGPGSDWVYLSAGTTINGSASLSTGTGPLGDTLTIAATVNGPLTTNSTLPSGTAGSPYKQNITEGSGGPYTFAVEGMLPFGLKLINGFLVGTPTVAYTFTFTLTAKSISGFTVSETFTVAIALKL
jgi:hypothetical protein